MSNTVHFLGPPSNENCCTAKAALPRTWTAGGLLPWVSVTPKQMMKANSLVASQSAKLQVREFGMAPVCQQPDAAESALPPSLRSQYCPARRWWRLEEVDVCGHPTATATDPCPSLPGPFFRREARDIAAYVHTASCGAWGHPEMHVSKVRQIAALC